MLKHFQIVLANLPSSLLLNLLISLPDKGPQSFVNHEVRQGSSSLPRSSYLQSSKTASIKSGGQ